MSKPLILHFVDAATDFEKLPETRAEVVFIGRSNVGKSSLLNAIGGKKKKRFVLEIIEDRHRD